MSTMKCTSGYCPICEMVAKAKVCGVPIKSIRPSGEPIGVIKERSSGVEPVFGTKYVRKMGQLPDIDFDPPKPRFIYPTDGYKVSHNKSYPGLYTHWTLPPQAKPNAQGNYVSTGTLGSNATLKKAMAVAGPLTKAPAGSTPQRSSLRMPEVGDVVDIRNMRGNQGTIIKVELGSGTKFQTFHELAPGSSLRRDVDWNDVDDFHHHLVTLSAVPSVPKIDRSKFPHDCKVCGSPSYNGFSNIECSNASCSANRGFVR